MDDSNVSRSDGKWFLLISRLDYPKEARKREEENTEDDSGGDGTDQRLFLLRSFTERLAPG